MLPAFLKVTYSREKFCFKKIYFFYIFNACFINYLQTSKNLIVLVEFLLA